MAPAATTGVDAIDLWIGGLAEKQMPFGGLLAQPSISSSRRKWRSCRTATASTTWSAPPVLNFLTELENNSFAKLIMANTDATHLPGDVFSTPAFILEVNQACSITQA
jgi:hypothetical protein